MTQAPDPDPSREDILNTINAAVREATAEMIAYLDQRHDALTSHLKQLETDLATLRRQGNDARRQNSLADVLVQQLLAMHGQPQEAPLPEPGADVPVEVEKACAANPADGAQRVDLTEYGTVAFIRPGSPPKAAWRDLQSAINTEEKARGVRRPRRARQR